MLAIRNNLMAEMASRQLGQSYDALTNSVARLSSGLRIRGAQDDAAGLAVRELMRADIATLRQGSRNAADGISMLQTAEGALGSVDEILVRMKELAEQAATGSYSSEQRSIMNSEFAQLAEEITRIAESTTFNDINLLNTDSSYAIHVGSSETITVEAAKMDAGTLGLSKTFEYNTNDNKATSASAAWYTADGTAFEFNFATDGITPTGGDFSVTLEDAAGGGQDSWTMTEIRDAINDVTRDAGNNDEGISGYEAAEIVYSSETGEYTLKLNAYTAGDHDMTVTTGADVLAAASWTAHSGSDAAGVSVDTQNNAVNALAALDDAIQTKDEARASFGYVMNRLEYAKSVTDIQAENLVSAESRISDVDVATEMAAMTRNQVLAQAGVSMLAQANQMPQMALQLLRG